MHKCHQKKINSILPLLKGETNSISGLTTKNPFKDLFNDFFFYSINLKFYKRDEINKITYLNGIYGFKDNELKEGKDNMLNKIMERLDQMDKTMISMSQKIISLDDKVNNIDNKVDSKFIEIHNKVDIGFKEIHNKVDSGFENINNRLDIIEKNAINLNGEVFGKKELIK